MSREKNQINADSDYLALQDLGENASLMPPAYFLFSSFRVATATKAATQSTQNTNCFILTNNTNGKSNKMKI